MRKALSDKTIILGVTGGIAAYKAAEICSALRKVGASVHVVMTRHATHFVGPVTFRALTGHQVITGLWDEPREHEITHVSLPDKADAFLIAPATANILAKIASGVADDMLSTMILATRSPVILAPAMNWKMWGNPITRANVERLESLGYGIVYPETGRLACGDEGVGVLADPKNIVRAVIDRLELQHDMEGVSVLITAGPTHESVDAVRFIGNRSSGKMGYACAMAAAQRGARVTLVSGPTSLCPPADVDFVPVTTAEEMKAAVMGRLEGVQVVIAAAAVADYTPKKPAGRKMKKTGGSLTLELAPTADILAEVGRKKGGRVLVGFAAETEHLLENAKAKLESKNLDLIVANDVSKPGIGFGADVNEVAVIDRQGSVQELPLMPKLRVAHHILDAVKRLL